MFKSKPSAKGIVGPMICLNMSLLIESGEGGGCRCQEQYLIAFQALIMLGILMALFYPQT